MAETLKVEDEFPEQNASPFGEDDFESPPDFDDGVVDENAAKKQRLIIFGALGAVLFLFLSWLFWPNSSTDAAKPAIDPNNPNVAAGPDGEIIVKTDDMTAQELAKGNALATVEGRLNQLENGEPNPENAAEIAKLEQQIREAESARGQNIPVPGQRSSAAMQSGKDQEIARLRQELTMLRSSQARATMSPESSSVQPTGNYLGVTRPSVAGPGQPVVGGGSGNAIKVNGYAGASGGKNAERGGLIFADSPDYLPPNAIATARVIVGADAQAGVRSSAEPIPVVLRVTSNARSVVQDGMLLKTKVVGCLVNGAAFADLSSEKVFVKLQKMTCNDGKGGVAISEVKGFVAFAGKAGVRGRVVSREGNFILKAFLAGLVGGIGNLGQSVAQSSLYGANIATNGNRPPIDLGAVAAGAGGGALSKGGDAVSSYLIERAEQYQPVVEMPTGIDVELVFLDGSWVR